MSTSVAKKIVNDKTMIIYCHYGVVSQKSKIDVLKLAMSLKSTSSFRDSGVFLTKFEVFGNVMKHTHECLLYLLNRN